MFYNVPPESCEPNAARSEEEDRRWCRGVITQCIGIGADECNVSSIIRLGRKIQQE